MPLLLYLSSRVMFHFIFLLFVYKEITSLFIEKKVIQIYYIISFFFISFSIVSPFMKSITWVERNYNFHLKYMVPFVITPIRKFYNTSAYLKSYFKHSLLIVILLGRPCGKLLVWPTSKGLQTGLSSQTSHVPLQALSQTFQWKDLRCNILES
jgi:hypothetical protein